MKRSLWITWWVVFHPLHKLSNQGFGHGWCFHGFFRKFFYSESFAPESHDDIWKTFPSCYRPFGETFHWLLLLNFRSVPSLKLTAKSTWNWWLEDYFLFWDPAFFQGGTVCSREGNFFKKGAHMASLIQTCVFVGGYTWRITPLRN